MTRATPNLRQRFPRFRLDEWLAAHETGAKYEIATSAIPPIKLAELDIDLSKTEVGYGDVSGSPELYAELARYEATPPDNVAVTISGSEANFLGLLSLLKPGDRVLVENPTYEPLAHVPTFAGATVDVVERKWNLDWEFDLDQVRRGFERGAKALVLANPNNPTGRALRESEVRRLADLAGEYDGFLFIDEIFRELAFEPLHPARGLADNVITTNSFSKCWGLGGLRIGWIVAPSTLVAEVKRIRGYTSGSPPVLSQIVAVEALRRREHLISRARRIRDENFALVEEFVQDSRALSWRPPSGGIICALRLGDGVDDEAFATRLVRERGTLVAPGRFFGIPGFLRVGYGTERRALEAGLDELEALATS